MNRSRSKNKDRGGVSNELSSATLAFVGGTALAIVALIFTNTSGIPDDLQEIRSRLDGTADYQVEFATKENAAILHAMVRDVDHRHRAEMEILRGRLESLREEARQSTETYDAWTLTMADLTRRLDAVKREPLGPPRRVGDD